MTQELDPALIEAPYPLQSHIGFKITAWQPDYARFELPLEPYLMNRYGIPHGGVHAMMLDTVMGFAGCYTGDRDKPQLGMTLNLNVNFVGQAKGKLLIAEAKVTDDQGNSIATGTGVFRYRS